jgi:hypothetical protein
MLKSRFVIFVEPKITYLILKIYTLVDFDIVYIILPPILNISHIVFGTEIKKHTFRRKKTMFSCD